MTIKDLEIMCREHVKLGDGNREIFLANDDEGNGFREMFYAFTTDEDKIKAYQELSYGLEGHDPKDICILG